MNHPSAPSQKSTATWFAGMLLCAVTVAWLSAKLHAHAFAPLILVSVAIGAIVGLILKGLAARLELARGRAFWTGVLLGAGLTVVAQHAWLYGEFRREWHASRAADPRIALMRSDSPPAPLDYFRREATPAQSALWVLDAVLIIVTVVVVTALGTRDGPTSDAPTRESSGAQHVSSP